MDLLNVIWNTRSYLFWLTSISILCLVLERLFAWRKDQPLFRREFWQDVFFLVFNGHYVGILLAHVTVHTFKGFNGLVDTFGLPHPDQLWLLASYPLWVQFVGFFLLKDFLEWCVHNLLHRVSWLWTFHKLHHTIVQLDWIGNFRFHWVEIVVYRTLTWLPLVALGVRGDVILITAVVSTLIGHLNHANLRISWGPFRYILNSARMHVWHHDVVLHHQYGQNFAVVFSLWDWLFGTAYMPHDREQPDQLGFTGMERFPRNLLARLVYPVGAGDR